MTKFNSKLVEHKSNLDQILETKKKKKKKNTRVFTNIEILLRHEWQCGFWTSNLENIAKHYICDKLIKRMLISSVEI